MASNSFDHSSDSDACSSYSLDFQETESSLSSLRALDDLFRCRICFDYFKNCVVTKCSHNYCSVCIRKYMSKKVQSQCPLCFGEAFESDLRDNKIMDEILRIYLRIKGNLPNCAPDVDPHSNDHPQPPMVQIKSEVTGRISQGGVAKRTRETTEEKEWDDVSCPICFKVMSTQHINIHLGRCLKSINTNYSQNMLVLRSYCKECTKEECSVYIPPTDERKYMCAFCGCYPTKHIKVDRNTLPSEVDITDSKECISPIRAVHTVQHLPSMPPQRNSEAIVAPYIIPSERSHSAPHQIHGASGKSSSHHNSLREQAKKRKRRLPARFRFSSSEDEDELSLSQRKQLLDPPFPPEFNEGRKIGRTSGKKIIKSNKEPTKNVNHPEQNIASTVLEPATACTGLLSAFSEVNTSKNVSWPMNLPKDINIQPSVVLERIQQPMEEAPVKSLAVTNIEPNVLLEWNEESLEYIPVTASPDENTSAASFSTIRSEDLNNVGIKQETDDEQSVAVFETSPMEPTYTAVTNIVNFENNQMRIPMIIMPSYEAFGASRADNFYKYSCAETINVREMLEKDEHGWKFLKAIALKRTLSASDISSVVRITVDRMVKDLQNLYPSLEQKINLAKAIVRDFPQLKLSRDGVEGYEHFFDPLRKEGKIEWRLKTARTMLLFQNKDFYRKKRKRKTQIEREEEEKKEQEDHKAQNDIIMESGFYNDKIKMLADLLPNERNKNEIFKVMQETFKFRRNYINHKKPPVTSILQKYPKLKEYNGELINIEFAQMYPNAGNLLVSFPSFYRPRILKYVSEKRGDMEDRITDYSQDANLTALLMLADLCPFRGIAKKNMVSGPSSSKQPSFPSEHILKFVGGNTEITTEAGNKHIGGQPLLLCKKNPSTDILQFFLVLDSEPINIGSCALIAMDIWYKSRYVFNIELSKITESFFTFLDTFIYKTQTEKTKSNVENVHVLLQNVSLV